MICEDLRFKSAVIMDFISGVKVKRELYQDLVKRNLKKLKVLQPAGMEMEASEALEEPNHGEDLLEQEKGLKLLLFKKSQKLIDRFLFVFFAEDRNLLPPNSTMQILDKWKADMDFGDERPIYELFKQYFGFLDTGRQGTASRAEIYAYNGGLFKPDEILDVVEIDSEILHKHTRKLASYDFARGYFPDAAPALGTAEIIPFIYSFVSGGRSFFINLLD